MRAHYATVNEKCTCFFLSCKIELKLHQYVPMTHEMHMTIIDLCDTAFSLNCKPRINIDNDNHF